MKDAGIEAKPLAAQLAANLGEFEALVHAALDEAARANVVQRIWEKDATVWKNEESHRSIIANSLGWLTVTDEMKESVPELLDFGDEIRASGFKQVLLCGMGGSSLCPEVLARTFGPQPGFPQLFVLDSTDPDYVVAFHDHIKIEDCLFVIASKSGTTTEPIVFYKYWYDQVAQRNQNPGDSFVAITDPGTAMVAEATSKGFRRIFLNRADIGGRYSALSYFGMVPAALMGLNLSKLLERASAMAEACGPRVAVGENPGAILGAAMAECAKAGRDKLTIVTDEGLPTRGIWIEQLMAESTGKEGKGILPVIGEPLGRPTDYYDDRVFVSLAVGEPGGEIRSRLESLEAAGHPVVSRRLNDSYDLGSEFFLWEFATAFAGWRLGINPFDQPNVQESKDATKELLRRFTQGGKLPEQQPVASDGVVKIYADESVRGIFLSNSVLEVLRAHLIRVKPRDYVALLAYVEETPAVESILQRIRTHLRDATKCATTVGYGPRFLHSTGQLHKGGPNEGVFIQITAPDKVDLAVPGEAYTFSILKQAQALGDFHALSSRGRRAIRVDLEDDTVSGLRKLEELIREALPAL
jgi:glucose-6-phosphate isomerase